MEAMITKNRYKLICFFFVYAGKVLTSMTHSEIATERFCGSGIYGYSLVLPVAEENFKVFELI